MARVNFAPKLAVNPAVTEEGIAVSHAQWRRIMTRLEECESETRTSENIAWTSLGVAGSALISAIVYPTSVQFSTPTPAGTEANVWAIVIQIALVALATTGFIVAWSCRSHVQRERQHRATLRRWMREDMESHAEKYPAIAPATLLDAQDA
jgi:hypothetical protein